VSALLFSLFNSLAFAEDYIAVLDVHGEVSEAVKMQLADETRSGALQALPLSQYKILTRENMLSLLKDMQKDPNCLEGQCEIDIGRNIGADFIVSGQVLQIEGTYLYSMKLHDTASGALIGTQRIEGENALSLIRKTSTATNDFLRDILKTSEPSKEENTNNDLKQQDDIDVLNVVQFNSIPSGAEVWIDNTQVCPTTPCSATIPSGFHMVEYRKDLYKPWKAEFQAKAGMEIRAELTQFSTKLYLETQVSGIQVFLDDMPIGITPLDTVNITPGPHVLRYEGKCSYHKEERIVAREGVDIFREITLQNHTSQLRVYSQNQHGKPLRGRIYIDGNFTGYTPFHEAVSSCANRIEVEATVNGVSQRRSLPLSLKKDNQEEFTFEFFVESPHKKKKYRKKKRRRR